MALTLTELKSDVADVDDVYIDRTDEGYYVLKQYEKRSPGDWVALTPSMLAQLHEWLNLEFGK